MSWWQIHHWENTLEKAEAWLKQEQKLGYTGEIKADGDVFLIVTWRI